METPLRYPGAQDNHKVPYNVAEGGQRERGLRMDLLALEVGEGPQARELRCLPASGSWKRQGNMRTLKAFGRN